MSVRSDRRGQKRGQALLTALTRVADDLHLPDRDEGAPQRLSRSAAELVGGRGAVLYLVGPGRMIMAGAHGQHPQPPRGELEVDGRVERVVRDGDVELLGDDGIAVPLVGVGGTLGAIAVYGIDTPATEDVEALNVLGHLAGPLFELSGVVRVGGGVDPVRGIGDHQRASAALASLEAGDAVALIELDDIAARRSGGGDAAAELAQVQLGHHLRNAVRPGDVVAREGDEATLVVLRQVRAPLGTVVARVLGPWISGPVGGWTSSTGAALHLPGRAPADTSDSARRTLQAALAGGGGRLFLASEAS